MTENAKANWIPPKTRMQPRAYFLLVLSLSLLGAGVISRLVEAIPAPGRSSVVTPGGQTTPCTYDNYQDSGKFIGKDCTTGDNKFSESTALALWNDENASGIARFWEGGTWTFGGVTVNNLSGVTDWGIYGQTIFKTTIASSVDLAIGNQNANDAIYHAFNYTVHDITFDGGGLGTTACLSITTALNVYVNHVILQNCFELATGCLRLTNWNANQILSKGVYIENSQFIQCKITLSGTVNGYLRNSAFIGQTPSDTLNYLVDFSKGDIPPTSSNNLGNFCFCGNTISGWTVKGVFAGFQAVSNDTIAQNTMRDAPSFLTLTDTSAGLYFEGLKIKDNYYSSATGGVSICYGHSIDFSGNILSFDTSVGGASTAISFEKSPCPLANQNPKNIQVTYNEIYKWGGVGMDLGFTDGIVTGNQIYDVNQANGNANSNAGIITGINLVNASIIANSIISDVASGAGASRPINYNGGTFVTITNNFLVATAFGARDIFFGATAASTVEIYNNHNFNPYGQVTNFIIAGFIGLCGTGATPSASTDYAVCTFPILVTSTGGTGVSIVVKDPSGVTVWSPGATISGYYLPLGYKINFGAFSVAPTVTVFGN